MRTTKATLLATLAIITLAACQPHAEMEQEQGTVTVNEITVQVQQLSSSSSTTTRADESIMAGVEKKNFVEGDVIHIMVKIGKSDLNSDNPCYTATLNANGRWTLNNPIVLPQDATKTYNIDAFYDGARAQYTNYTDWNTAYNAAIFGTPSDGSNLRKYVDLLYAGGGNLDGSSWTDQGIVITSNGKLTITMKHWHALLRIASITNNLGSPVTSIVANLTDDSDNSLYTLALATTPAATTPVENAEAIAKWNRYLKSFTITLENGRHLTVDAPGYNSNPAPGTSTDKGTYLNSGKSYTYRLHLNPGSLTAIPTDGMDSGDLGWGEKDDPNVPAGYTPIYNRAGLEAIGKSAENLGKSYILMADIDLTPGMPDGSGGTNENWKPITTIDNGIILVYFTGIFNGNGHTIKGMTISSTEKNQGLFDYIRGNAILYNIHLRDVNVTGGDNTGALVGFAYGTTTISGCSSTGTVSGAGYVGGLVGNNNSHITRCWSTATVTGSVNNIGGLVGNNNGSIVACYTQGSKVSGGTGSTANVFGGGLVGYNDSSVFGCYAAQAAVSSTGTNSIMGALVGINDFGTVTSCYATNASVSSGNKLAGGNGKAGKLIACISPLADATGEVGGGTGTVTAVGEYAPLVSKDASDNELSILGIRTVIPTIDTEGNPTNNPAIEAAGNLGAITAVTRSWTALGIWGTLAEGSKIPPHIIWTYNGGITPPAPPAP